MCCNSGTAAEAHENLCIYSMFGNSSLFNPKDYDLLTSQRAYSPPDHCAFLYCRDRSADGALP